MAGDAEDRLWRAEELEILVQWIEEPGNQARFKKGFSLTKKLSWRRLWTDGYQELTTSP